MCYDFYDLKERERKREKIFIAFTNINLQHKTKTKVKKRERKEKEEYKQINFLIFYKKTKQNKKHFKSILMNF